MKKYFPYILILVVVVGIFFPAHFSYAQSTPEGPSFWNLLGGGADLIVKTLLQVIFLGIFQFLNYILGLAGGLLNYVIKFSILDMSVFLNGGTGLTGNYAGVTGINIGWKIIRDLMNILFIFILVYEGIKLILDIDNLQSVRKFIFGVVMASLLINFSLFFTKVLIDASNIFTTGLYNIIVAAAPPGSVNYGISDIIQNIIKINSIFGGPNINPSFGDTAGAVLVSGIGFGAIIGITIFIFLAVSIMLIIRFMTLLFLLMLSPIAYMGLAIPALRSYANEWWDSLKGQLLFPPIFFAMLLIVIKLMASPGFITNGGAFFSELTNSDSGQNPSTGLMSLIFNFAVTIGLLITSLVTAKKWANMGSKHIGTATKSLTGFAGGAVFGGAARLSRNTIGRAGNAIANNERVKDLSANGNFVTRNLAKAGIASGTAASTSSLDVRATKTFGALSKNAGMGTDFGKVDTKKTNFRADLENKAKAEEEKIARLEPTKLEKDKAENVLKTEEFKAAEEKRRKEYFESDEYKNSEKGRRDALILKSKEDFDIFKKEEERLVKEKEDIEKKLNFETVKNDPNLTAQFRSELVAKENEITAKATAKKTIEDAYNANKKAIDDLEYEKNTLWMSDEKKSLISRKGGQEEKKDKGGKITQVSVDSTYQQRAKAVAERYESTMDGKMAPIGWIGRKLRFVTGTAAGAVLPVTPKTKSDRAEIARRIRAKAKAKKSVDDRLKEILKDEGEIKEAETEKPTETPPTSTTPTEESPKV